MSSLHRNLEELKKIYNMGYSDEYLDSVMKIINEYDDNIKKHEKELNEKIKNCEIESANSPAIYKQKNIADCKTWANLTFKTKKMTENLRLSNEIKKLNKLHNVEHSD